MSLSDTYVGNWELKFPIQVQKFGIPENLKVSISKIRIIYRTLICDIFKFDIFNLTPMKF